MAETIRDRARYTWGGDEFLFIEMDEAMSLTANFKVMTVAKALMAKDLPGIVDICPANASLLIKFDPDELDHTRLESTVRQIEESAEESDGRLDTRIIELPVWYDDPFTSEVEQKFRDGYHQDPSGSDLDYAAQVNGLTDKAEFIERHHSQPWLVTMVGFVAGLPFSYQIVDRPDQLVVPKYLSPRTDTPPLTIGHGGCFAAIYSVRGAGGYQMFGVGAAPIYDPAQKLADFADSSVLFRPGDVIKFRSIEQPEYEEIRQQVADGTFRYKQAPVTFDLERTLSDFAGSNSSMMEVLHGA